jgi:hypothetical protein
VPEIGGIRDGKVSRLRESQRGFRIIRVTDRGEQKAETDRY